MVSAIACGDLPGIRHWLEFAKKFLGDEKLAFPPQLRDLLAYSHSFRCVGTYHNYVGFVRKAAVALDLPVPPANCEAISHAKAAVLKRQLFTSRPKMFIQSSMVRNLVARATDINSAMLWLASYVFLLRVPSEALPMARGEYLDTSLASQQSVLYLDSDSLLCLKLKSRKNKLGGSLLQRRCSCIACPAMCPVHVLWESFFKRLPVGTQPWASISAGQARYELRLALKALKARCVHAHAMARCAVQVRVC